MFQLPFPLRDVNTSSGSKGLGIAFANKLKEFYEDTQPKLKDTTDAHHQALDDVADEILNGKYCVGGTCED